MLVCFKQISSTQPAGQYCLVRILHPADASGICF